MNIALRSIQPAAAAPIPAATEFAALLERIHAIGREVIAPHSESVDREARFPLEAFDALRAEKLLSCYIPAEFGGMGLELSQVAKICETLGQYCASTAMIFAMHQIQVACIAHHALGSPFFRDYAREISSKQHLVASATTEMGIGGDTRSSICAVKVVDNYFMLEKQAPVISYGAYADSILVTCRRNDEAPKNDQVLVLVRQDDCTLKQLSVWDTLGFRGTCSPGFELKSIGKSEQIFPASYGEIHSQTQHPVAHLLWASLWLGLGHDALGRARSAVRAEARKNPGTTPISATRLAEADLVLNSLRSLVQATLSEYERLLAASDTEAFSHFGFVVRVNNLKLSASQMLLDIVQRAMIICGIQGYRNDSKLTLGRHLRDAMGASLMVNNDRILSQNATMHIGIREA